MLVEPVAVSFVVLPVALVHIAVRVPELPLAVGFVLVPLSLVLAAIGPDLGTPARLNADLRGVAMVNGLRIRRLNLLDLDKLMIDDELFEARHLLLSLRLVVFVASSVTIWS